MPPFSGIVIIFLAMAVLLGVFIFACGFATGRHVGRWIRHHSKTFTSLVDVGIDCADVVLVRFSDGTYDIDSASKINWNFSETDSNNIEEYCIIHKHSK